MFSYDKGHIPVFYPDTQKATVTLLNDKWRRSKQLSLEEFPGMTYIICSPWEQLRRTRT